MIQRIEPENKEKISNLCEEFLNLIPSNKSLQGFCFTICYPLSLYLYYKGFKNSLSLGAYDGIPHYWINLDNYADIIVDPTVIQFGNYSENNKIYIDIKNAHYYQVNDFIDIRIRQARECWKKKMQNDFDLLVINMKAALIILNETGSTELSKTEECKIYLHDIKEIITSIDSEQLISCLKPKFPKSIFENLEISK